MAASEADTTTSVLAHNPPSDSAEASGGYALRATSSWNRLNAAIVRTVPRNLRRAEAARRRIARMR